MDVDEVLALEHRGWESLCRGDGAEFYGELMTADAVMILAHGLVLDRDAVVGSLDDAPAWQRYEISDERYIELDDHNVILVYTGRASRDDGETSFHALMTSVYAHRGGRWRLRLYQQTPVPPDAA